MDECELKFKIVDKNQDISLHKMLQDIGAYYAEDRLEVDYIVDLINICENGEGMMLRFREIYCHDILQNILITLKIRNSSDYCLNNTEIEYSLKQKNYPEIVEINRILSDTLKMKINFEEFISKNIVLQTFLEKENLLKYALTYSKQREEYRFGASKISFDSFIDSIGDFIEIETKSEKELKEMLEVLHLNYVESEKRNYGKILREGL